MNRADIDKAIKEKIKQHQIFGGTEKELKRQLLVSGIRQLPGEKDFLRPYPENEISKHVVSPDNL